MGDIFVWMPCDQTLSIKEYIKSSKVYIIPSIIKCYGHSGLSITESDTGQKELEALQLLTKVTQAPGVGRPILSFLGSYRLVRKS